MTSKKKVTFSEEDPRVIPANILESYTPQDEVTWEDVAEKIGIKKKKLKKATLKIQAFIRDKIKQLEIFNAKKCALLEELDNIELLKQQELKRVHDYLADLKREATIAISEEVMNTPLDETMKQEIKTLEANNAQLKEESEALKVQNKQLALDTFAMYEQFAISVADVKGMETEKKRMLNIVSQFEEAVGMLQGLAKRVHKDTKKEKKLRKRLEQCVDSVISAIEERYQQKKLSAQLWDMRDAMIQAEFLAHMPMQQEQEAGG